MLNYSGSALFLVALTGFSQADAQASGKAVVPQTSYAQEAFAIEQFSRKSKFENDGTYTRDVRSGSAFNQMPEDADGPANRGTALSRMEENL